MKNKNEKVGLTPFLFNRLMVAKDSLLPGNIFKMGFNSQYIIAATPPLGSKEPESLTWRYSSQDFFF
jgi:hypothetical protein